MVDDGRNEAAAQADPRHGLVLTAVGPDRPGLVQSLAGQLRKRGGNLEDTRMSKLGGEFAVLMLVTGARDSLSDIESAIKDIELATGLSCSVRPTVAQAEIQSDDVHRFVATGVDRPGIVESVTQVLAERGVNLTSLESYVDNAPLTGTLMFILEAEITLPSGVSLEQLEQELAEACEREDLEFTLMGS